MNILFSPVQADVSRRQSLGRWPGPKSHVLYPLGISSNWRRRTVSEWMKTLIQQSNQTYFYVCVCVIGVGTSKGDGSRAGKLNDRHPTPFTSTTSRPTLAPTGWRSRSISPNWNYPTRNQSLAWWDIFKWKFLFGFWVPTHPPHNPACLERDKQDKAKIGREE